MEDVLQPYADAMNRFVNKEITAQQFEAEYLELFRNETELIDGDEFHVLDEVFYYVDEYTPDPELRQRAGGFDDDELYAHVRRCRDRLLALKKKTSRIREKR